MKIILSVAERIMMIDNLLHTVSMVAGLIAGGFIMRMLPYMYIGKAFMLYICLTAVIYAITRIILCSMFRPVVRSYRRKMS